MPRGVQVRGRRRLEGVEAPSGGQVANRRSPGRSRHDHVESRPPPAERRPRCAPRSALRLGRSRGSAAPGVAAGSPQLSPRSVTPQLPREGDRSARPGRELSEVTGSANPWRAGCVEAYRQDSLPGSAGPSKRGPGRRETDRQERRGIHTTPMTTPNHASAAPLLALPAARGPGGRNPRRGALRASSWTSSTPASVEGHWPACGWTTAAIAQLERVARSSMRSLVARTDPDEAPRPRRPEAGLLDQRLQHPGHRPGGPKNYPLESIKRHRFRVLRPVWKKARRPHRRASDYSLDDIEHGIVRPLGEPREPQRHRVICLEHVVPFALRPRALHRVAIVDEQLDAGHAHLDGRPGEGPAASTARAAR